MKTAMACLLLLLCLPAEAAVVRLKDGGAVEGEVEKADATEVIVRTPSGPRRIAASLVSGIDYEKSAAAPAARRPYVEIVKDSFAVGLGLAVPLSDVNFNS